MPSFADVQVPYVEAAEIDVDARRDEAAWAAAGRLPGPFVTFAPRPGGVPLGNTDVWALSDADRLYLYFDAQDPEPHRIRASLGRRDTRFADDFVGLYLDTSGDAQRAYLFVVTAAGVLADGVRVGQNDDVSWDAPWTAATRRTDTGYTVEIAIPWSSVRHPRVADTLGLFALRHIPRAGERSSWPTIDPAIQGLLVQQAIVEGPGPLPAAPPLDLLPEVSFAWDQEGPADDRPGYGGVMPGGTIRWSPSPSVGILGTVNPDFSQVESDSAQVGVNRRYALYFQEKRPFFLDGREWFDHPFDQVGELVYTRAMVVPLAGARATVEAPNATVAALHVLDSAPAPSVSEGGGWTEEDLADHSALESVVRARHAVGSDGHVGAILSDRTIFGTQMANRVGGIDTRIRLSDQTQISASGIASWTRFADGSEGTGPAGQIQLQTSGKHPYAGIEAHYVHPDFRAENGFVTAADRMGGGGWAGTQIFTPYAALPQASVTPVNGWALVDTDGALRAAGTNPNAWASVGGILDVNAGANLQREVFADADLDYARGWWWVGGALSRWIEVGTGGSVGSAPLYDEDDPRVGDRTNLEANATLRPVPRLSLGGGVVMERFVEGGDLIYEGVVGRAQGEIFLTRKTWLRTIGNLSTFDEARSAEALVAYEHQPGSALYLGGRVGHDPDPSWSIFAKGSWRWTPGAP